jgi:hypothetical protein
MMERAVTASQRSQHHKVGLQLTRYQEQETRSTVKLNLPTITLPTPSNNSQDGMRMIVNDEVSLQEAKVDTTESIEVFLRMARICAQRHLYSVALNYYSQALKLQKKSASSKCDTERLLLADIVLEIGNIHIHVQDPMRALASFDLCRSIYHDILEWHDEKNANVLFQQARVFTLIGDSESAVCVLEELTGILCCIPKKNATLLRVCWLELARHQDRLGMSSEAESSRKEAKMLLC